MGWGGGWSLNALISPMDLLMSPLSEEERRVSTELNDRHRDRVKSGSLGVHLKEEHTGSLFVMPQGKQIRSAAYL